ncbi:MAG TPA: hypothetical protein VFE51_15040 [Verrucomicrobiae bacterium]|nr:hypothetical protein [Verrucomicrobiae bacterium]
MKVQGKKGALTAPKCYQFRLTPGNLVRVEVVSSGVVIRSTAILGIKQRTAFIRYLIQEGFIPESLITPKAGKGVSRIDWLIRRGPPQRLCSAIPWIKRGVNRWMLQLLGFAFFVWVIEMAILLLKN